MTRSKKPQTADSHPFIVTYKYGETKRFPKFNAAVKDVAKKIEGHREFAKQYARDDLERLEDALGDLARLTEPRPGKGIGDTILCDTHTGTKLVFEIACDANASR